MTRRVVSVAGSHTDIGKTHVACGLLQAARARGLAVDALKPVVSGLAGQAWGDSDTARLLWALGRADTDVAIDQISPWRFAAPLAPPWAAEAEGRRLPFEPIAAFCQTRIAQSACDLMIVEGAGGLMSPLAEQATSLDLLQALGGQSILVGGGYLGAMSHTLTALEVMRSRGVGPVAIVVSADRDPRAPNFSRSVSMMTAYAGPTPVIPAPRGDGGDWADRLLRLIAL